jgi:hypothetical protein
MRLHKIYGKSSCQNPASPVTFFELHQTLKNMAKAAAKTTTRTETKKPRAPRAKASTNNIEAVSEEALGKLQQLGIEDQLQRDLQWCLGSYRADRNPVGLYNNARKALTVLKNEKEKKTKGVTAKLISDLEKAVQEQPD